MATLEAMAFGKPVVCYIKKLLSEVYGPDLPVVNATQETLAEALLALLQDARRRQELGRLGRAYVEQYADMKIVAPQILAAYREITSRFRMDHV
jgi:glycosyltransferase involved in cell wall biosynthesis